MNNNWLNYTDTDTTTCTITTGTTCCCVGSCSCNWTYTPTYTNWITSPVTIKLKFSEVEYLRKRCKDDNKLKKILSKFGPHIEIEVDF